MRNCMVMRGKFGIGAVRICVRLQGKLGVVNGGELRVEGRAVVARRSIRHVPVALSLRCTQTSMVISIPVGVNRSSAVLPHVRIE